MNMLSSNHGAATATAVLRSIGDQISDKMSLDWIDVIPTVQCRACHPSDHFFITHTLNTDVMQV